MMEVHAMHYGEERWIIPIVIGLLFFLDVSADGKLINLSEVKFCISRDTRNDDDGLLNR